MAKRPRARLWTPAVPALTPSGRSEASAPTQGPSQPAYAFVHRLRSDPDAWVRAAWCAVSSCTVGQSTRMCSTPAALGRRVDPKLLTHIAIAQKMHDKLRQRRGIPLDTPCQAMILVVCRWGCMIALIACLMKMMAFALGEHLWAARACLRSTRYLWAQVVVAARHATGTKPVRISQFCRSPCIPGARRDLRKTCGVDRC